ncbi:MAG: DUF6156 family protein [Hyphomicrobiales bacterium]|nr:DUF6156 family protein [Hyphomicrobiales bacterium]
MSQPPAPAPGETVAHFVTYSGVRPPVRLVEPIEAADMGHRNTFIRAVHDAEGRLVRFDKMVYGTSELTHVHRWSDEGRLVEATITVDEETTTLRFDTTTRG